MLRAREGDLGLEEQSAAPAVRRSSIHRWLWSTNHSRPSGSGMSCAKAVASCPRSGCSSRKPQGRVVMRPSSSGRTTCKERSRGSSPRLLASQRSRGRDPVSICRTGRSMRSHRGLPRPASWDRTDGRRDRCRYARDRAGRQLNHAHLTHVERDVPYELVWVDNGSDDAERHAIHRSFTIEKSLLLGTNFGMAYGFNSLFFRLCSAPYFRR